MDFALTAIVQQHQEMGGFPGSLPPCVFTTSGERGGGGRERGRSGKEKEIPRVMPTLVPRPHPTQLTQGEGFWCHKSKSLGWLKKHGMTNAIVKWHLLK